MVGGIYSREKCGLCGRNMKDTGRGMACPEHPKQRNDHGLYVKVAGITKRFNGDYAAAVRFLTGIRFKKDEGSFDRRDYAADRPLAFANLIAKWLDYKKDEVSTGYHQHLLEYGGKATDYFGLRNIKEIKFADLEDFSKSLTVGNKTRKNILDALHHFFAWCKRRDAIEDMPQFPTIRFELGYRQVVGKDTQIAIVEEVRRIAPPKTWLAIRWLCTYINVRPAEMISLKERDIDIENGLLLFPHPKEDKYKTSPLIAEDVEILRSFPVAFSGDMLFFRHPEGAPFGKKYLYKVWKKACGNLGISGVDLYGGTRHSSARALRQHFSPEQIKRATGSATNVAFERYYKIENDEVRNVFSQSRPAPNAHQLFNASKIVKPRN